MKIKLLLCIALLSVVVSSLFGQEKENNDFSNHLITVGEYVGFLNQVAASSNVNDLYEATNKQISCRGRLGDYYYEQIASQADEPMFSLSWRSAEEYCDWKNSSEGSTRKREGVDECYYVLQPSSEALEEVDQELKSNLLTFRIISIEAKAYQASGEEAFCSSLLDDLLEGVFLIAGAGNAITRQPRAIELEESTRDTPDIGQQVTTQERQEIDNVIRNSSFARLREHEALGNNAQLPEDWWREIEEEDQGHYGAVNKLWNEHAKKWSAWIVARKNLKRKQERLAAVQQESEEIEKALNDEDLSQTKMGKFITFCDDITSVAEYAPAIHNFNLIALVSQGASVITTRIQEGMVQLVKQRAKEAIEKAAQEVSAGEAEAHAVLQGILGQDPQQTEEIARGQEAEKVMKTAEELQRSFPASRFSKDAWKKAMHAYDQEVFTQGINAIEHLAPLKNSYQQVEKRRQEQEEAQERITIASHWKAQARKVLDSVIAECPLPDKERSLRDNQLFLSKRKDILEASRYHEKLQQIEEELERRLQKMKFFAPQIEKKAIKLYEEYQSAQEALTLELERAKVRAEAYHAAWRKGWPEEALKEEITLGEKNWKKALQYQEEESWEMAEKRAAIVNELQTRLSPLCSEKEKEEWSRREKIAHAKVAFFKLQRSDFSFLQEAVMNESSHDSLFPTHVQESIQQIDNIAKLLKPVSQEADKAFCLIARTLSSIEKGTKVAGWHATINERVEKIQAATQKLQSSLWKKEARWINSLAEQIRSAFVPNAREESKSASSESRFNVPGKLLKSGSSYGAFLEISPRGVQIRYTNAPQEISEKKELVELAKLKKTSKVLQQKIKQLRGQVSYQVAERSKIEALQQKSLAKIAEIAAKSEEQAKFFAAQEAELRQQAAAFKDESESIRQEKEAELKRLQEALAREQEAFEAAQEARLTAVLTNLDQQTKALKAQEEELHLVERRLEEVMEQYQAIIGELQQQLRTAQQEIEVEKAAKLAAEERVAWLEKKISETEDLVRHLRQDIEAVQQKVEIEKAARLAAEAEVAQLETRIEKAKQKVRNLIQEKGAVEQRSAQNQRIAEERARDIGRLQQQCRAAQEEAERATAARVEADTRATQAEVQATSLRQAKEVAEERSIQNQRIAEERARDVGRLQQQCRAAQEEAERATAARVEAETRAIQEETRAVQAEVRITMLEAEINALRQEKEIAEINIQIEELRRLASESKIKADASSVKADASSDFEQLGYQKSSRLFNEAVEYLNNAIIAISSNHAGSTTLWKEAAVLIKRAAEKCQESAQMWQKDRNQGRCLAAVASSFLMEARDKKYSVKVNEAIGRVELAQKWRDVVQQNQQASEYFIRSVEGHAAINEEKRRNLNLIGSTFLCIARASEKVIEAEEERKLAVVQAWREVTRQYKQSMEFYKKAAKVYVAGKKKETECWDVAGYAFYNAVAKLEKSIETEEAGRGAIAVTWRQSAELQKQSVEFFKKAAEAYAVGKENEAISWKNVGNAFYYAAEKLGKAIEADEAGKPVVAQAWREAAAVQEQSVEFHKKAAEAHVVEKAAEGIKWNKVGYSFYHAAEKLGKAIVADEAGKPVVARAWRDAAEKYQHAHTCWKKTAEAVAAGNWLFTGENEATAATAAAEAASQDAERLGNAQP